MLPQAVGIGGAAGQRLAIAAADGDLRLRYRLASIERGDPDQRTGAALLDVHAQVRHQRAGAYIHVALLKVGIQQVLAQHRRRYLDHVVARRQRNADHLERARILLVDLWHRHGLGLGFALQQRQHARFHAVIRHALVAVFAGRLRQRGRQLAQAVLACAAALDQGLVVICQLAVPADDLGIGLRCQRADLAGWLQGLAGQIALHAAQCHRQQRRALGAFGKALQHPKRRGGKLDQRRHWAGGDCQRKTAGVAQGPAGIVLQALRQHQAHAGLFRERRLELDRAHAALLLRVQFRLAWLAVDFQHHLACLLDRYRCAETHGHRADWQAGRLRIWPFATHAGFQRRAHLVVPAALRCLALAGELAQRQADARFGRQLAVAGQQHELVRLLFGIVGKPARLQDLLARLAADQAQRHRFAHAFDAALGRGLYLGGIDGTVEAQDEDLVLADLAAPGLDITRIRCAAAEGDAGRRQGIAIRCAEAGRAGGGTTYAGRQHVLEISRPGARVAPTAVMWRNHCLRWPFTLDAERGLGLRVAGRYGILVEAHQELAHLAGFTTRRDAFDFQGQGRTAGDQRQCRQGPAQCGLAQGGGGREPAMRHGMSGHADPPGCFRGTACWQGAAAGAWRAGDECF